MHYVTSTNQGGDIANLNNIVFFTPDEPFPTL